MKKRKLLLLLALLVLVPFSKNAPCRMSDMSIVCGLGLDYQNGVYTASVQYLDLTKGSGKSDGITGNITAVAVGRGSTVEKAIHRVQQTLSDELFFGQTEVLVFGKGVSRDALLAYIRENDYLRADIMLAQTDGSAEAVIANPLRGAVVPAGGLVKQIRDSRHPASINDFLRDNGIELPRVRVYKEYCVVE